MASALLASSRNEPFWGEPKVYMRKNPSTNPNPNPRLASENRSKDRLRATPASTPFLDRNDHAAEIDEPTSAGYGAVPAASDDSSSFNRHKGSGKPSNNHRHHLNRSSGKESSFDSAFVAFDIATYSRRELQELKRRLISELEQVRSLSIRIKSGEQPARSACFSTSGYGGGHGGGREVTSAAVVSRPPPVHNGQSPTLDSPPRPAASDRRTPKGGNPYQLPATESPSAGGAGMASFSLSDNDKHSFGKRSLPLTSPRESKRQAIGESEKSLTAMMKKCVQILTKLMKHRYGWVFNSPVDVTGLGLHDYYQIIKRPMDLGSVKSKLDKSFYTSPLEFAADVRLTFNNALLYNPEGHDVHKMAEQLLNLFEKLFADACKAYEKQAQSFGKGEEEERRGHSRSSGQAAMEDASSRAPPAAPSLRSVDDATPSPPRIPPPAPSSSPPLPPAHLQPVAPAAKPELAGQSVPARAAVGKQPKPKAKDPNKREMSFEEKKKLSLGLQSLPQEKMAQVLQIVQRRNPDPALHGDEIELDFETLDTETLWELDRFVGNCKKMMSKIKRQEAMLTAAPAPPGPPSETAANSAEKNLPTAMEAPEPGKRVGKKAGELGEEDVDIGEEMPSSNFPPVEIEKDTGNRSESSSSSSSSGSDSSSSSDSDSRSSAESDSDADDAQSPAVG